MSLHPAFVEGLFQALFWSALTIGLYGAAKRVHRRWPRWWLMPLSITPLLVGLVLFGIHASYREYIHATGWLLILLGPATVAFAVPIYEQRRLIRAQWPVLLVGVLAGSLTAMVSSWGFATLAGLDDTLRVSLVPRSLSTPFAMAVSADIGGVPDLTAIFVVVTGIAGAVIGDIMLTRLRLESAIARGALFGVGAHGAGTARAHQLGRTEGAVAGLVMVMVGLANVLAAPLLAQWLR
ncbi:LrgB family protein [Verticiella sediminum]|uniref:LrgB family protein n=1 Tax=Verticiella sediminum TaxID=1247510 RepID=A0A556AIK8_9BURK|nr:LrgB family protein [Verticiella sediminum]TSH92733.1 LrgB family protein [Verticiella sediminum]